MAAVDVPVALLGYGTVGAAVNRLLIENGDEIERATGHRIRVVRALVRDPARERSFPADDDLLTTDFESICNDPSIALVAEVIGGVEPAADYVLQLLPRPQAGRLGEQAADRAPRSGDLPRRLRGGRPASLRGQRLRRDPADQGSPRVARRDERPSRARNRQRDDQLHPHAHGGRRRLRPGLGGGAAARLRGGRSDRRRLGGGRGGEDGDPGHRCFRRPRRPRGRALRGHRARAPRARRRRRASST
jgi:hypothetical protein